jgi:hypothetical protein
MTDDLITALSIARQFVPNGTEAAERVDTAMRAALEAQIAAVAPAVDAQPVAWRHKATKILRNDSIAKGADFEPDDWEPLYASAQSGGLRKALTEIAEQEHVELMLDPTWAQRIAIAALSQHTGEQS